MVRDDFLITKSNTLIQSRYELTLSEQRIILMLASLVQPEDDDFKDYELRVDEFMEILGMSGGSSYTNLQRITKELMSKTFEIRSEKSLLQINWLASCEYVFGSGKVLLSFSPKLKPHLLHLKEYFTSYKLSNILNIRTKYGIRFYEILKSEAFKGTVTFTLDELRYMLCCENYQQWGHLKARVIEPAVTDVNLNTDLLVDYEMVKEGRKVAALRFSIDKNMPLL